MFVFFVLETMCSPNVLAVSEDRGYTWTPQNIDPELPQRDTWIHTQWREDMVLGYIPQVLTP